jgi:hypothetical protein
MKFAALMLLVAGWIIVLGAVVLLKDAAQALFVLAGICVQALGLVLLFRAHLALRSSLR